MRFWAVCLWAEESRFPDAECPRLSERAACEGNATDGLACLQGPYLGDDALGAQVRHDQVEAGRKRAGLATRWRRPLTAAPLAILSARHKAEVRPLAHGEGHDSAIDQGGPDAVRCKPKAEGSEWP
jgi:hypothetical protein